MRGEESNWRFANIPVGETEKQVAISLSRKALLGLIVELMTSHESRVPTGRVDLHSRRLNLFEKNLKQEFLIPIPNVTNATP